VSERGVAAFKGALTMAGSFAIEGFETVLHALEVAYANLVPALEIASSAAVDIYQKIDMSAIADVSREAGEKLLEILKLAAAQGSVVGKDVMDGAQKLAEKGLPMLKKLSEKVVPLIHDVGAFASKELMGAFQGALRIAGPTAMQAYELVLEAITSVCGEIADLAPKVLEFGKEGTMAALSGAREAWQSDAAQELRGVAWSGMPQAAPGPRTGP